MSFTIKKGVLKEYKGKDKTVVIPDSVTEIGYCAFSGCGSLKEINIPDSVTEIGDYAFSWCSSLEKVVIPNGVNILIKKYKELEFKEISDELNKYINTRTKALLYFDNFIKLSNLNYKTDLCNYPNIIIRGYENIEITDEERLSYLS